MKRRAPAWLSESPPEERRRILTRAIYRYGGNLRRLTHYLGYSRRHVYRLVESLHLWPVVNEARAEHRRELDIARRLRKYGV